MTTRTCGLLRMARGSGGGGATAMTCICEDTPRRRVRGKLGGGRDGQGREV